MKLKRAGTLLLWGVGLSLVGLLWWFPDGISQLRRSTAPYATMDSTCDLSLGPCTASFPDGGHVTMEASPQPVRSAAPLSIFVTVEGTGQPQAIEIQGAEMAMGFLRFPLEPTDGGWVVQTTLPVCTTARMKWRADIILDDRVAGFELWSVR